jgi:hypothetical protein
MMFGYQDAQNRAALSHSFATFVHATIPADAPERTAVTEQIDISWLPARFGGTVCVDLLHLRCPAVTGHNYSLAETLSFAENEHLTVGVWGPVEVRKDLFDRAKAQQAYLESGATGYVANDTGLHLPAYNHRGGALNCIHAVSDLAFFDRTGLNWGLDASRIVWGDFQPWRLNGGASGEWIWSGIGVDASRMIRMPDR